MRRLCFFVSFLVLSTAAALSADTVRLRNGRVIHGQVVRYANGEFIIEPTGARAQYQDRMIVLAETVESIEFDTGGAAVSAPAEKLVVLDAQQEVVATGVKMRRGETIRITASGEMQFADGRVSGPGGLETRESWPFPGERFGVLVALVGDPQSTIYHVIGESAEFEARTDGELFLQINARSLQGARGAYTARITTPQTTALGAGSTPATAPPAGARQTRVELEIPADQEWTDTGLDVLKGDTIRISAEGTIHYTSSKTCGPEGGKREWKDLLRGLPVNDAGRGALIGKMGESGTVRAFFVGDRAEFVAERNGRIFLGINDDNYGNNSGSFKVIVEIISRR